MTNSISFYLDFKSPYSYLAFTQLPKLIERHDVKVEYISVNVLDVMKAVKNSPTTLLSPIKNQYTQDDLRRWAKRYQVPLTINRHFTKFSNDAPARLLLAARKMGCETMILSLLFKAIWVDGENLADQEMIISYLEKNSVKEASLLLAQSHGQDVKEQLAKNNLLAIENKIFGVPSFLFNQNLFFGNDRLDFLEDALAN